MSFIVQEHLSVKRSRGALPNVPFQKIKEKVLGKEYFLDISFVGSETARNLNKKYRGKLYVPNTLSFSLSKKSGQIVMCMKTIQTQYKKYDMTLKNFIVYLLIHSMLHLKGYEHGGTMEKEEKRLLRFFLS